VPEETYKDRDELIKWVKGQAEKLHFTVVIVRSDQGLVSGKPSFVLGCERGGAYRPSNNKAKKKVSIEERGSRKIGCPFRLRGYLPKSKEWNLTIVSGIHNHVLDKALQGHLVAGRLKPEEKEMVVEMSGNLIPPRNIMSTLKKRNPDSVTSIKQLYNAKHRLKLAARGSRSEMQQLLKCLEENNYYFKVRTVGESDTIQDLFLAHRKSIQLFNTFNDVLLMDSTYKTNRYKMPLFEIVGCTSTNKTFGLGFAFLSNEKHDNFVWALQQVQMLLVDENSASKVIVTDRDAALMSVIPDVFPNATPLVCRFHIKKNVSARCSALCKIKHGEEEKQGEVVRNIMSHFYEVLNSPTEEAYAEAVLKFRTVCERWPRFYNYVKNTVLDTDEKKVVSAWTNRVMHFGNTTTNKAESSHAVLKKYLLDPNGDFVKVWGAIHDMLVNQHTEIQATFGISLSLQEHRYNGKPMYNLVVYKVSRHALGYIHEEAKRAEEVGMDSKKCGCVLAKKICHNRPIRLDEINNHWKKLVFNDREDVEQQVDDYSCLAEWNAIQERLRTVDVPMKAQIREQLRQIAFPHSTSLKPPVVVGKNKGVKRKGACGESSTTRSPSYWEHVEVQFPPSQSSQATPSSSKQKGARTGKVNPIEDLHRHIPFLDATPLFMHSHIEDIVDVDGDGFCGFRVIVLDTRNNQADYELIRLNLQKELGKHKDEYLTIFGSMERYQYIYDASFPPTRRSSRRMAPREKWLTFPDMGHIIASYFNKVVVLLTKNERSGASETFFPLRGTPPKDPDSKILCIGGVPDHFVYVKLKQHCPLPPTCKTWTKYFTQEASSWQTSFVDRQADFVGTHDQKILTYIITKLCYIT
ncbi:unnamed protein product, partial [Trifolium pratense]